MEFTRTDTIFDKLAGKPTVAFTTDNVLRLCHELVDEMLKADELPEPDPHYHMTLSERLYNMREELEKLITYLDEYETNELRLTDDNGNYMEGSKGMGCVLFKDYVFRRAR